MNNYKIHAFDHCELYVGNAKQAAHYYQYALGFTPISYSGLETGARKKVSYVMQQGKVKFVLSNKPDALGIIKAKKLGIKTFVFPINKNHNLKFFEKKLLNLLVKEKIDLLCLAGFMKILSKNFIKNYKGIILNIHPSILPSIRGLNTHQRILEKDINNGFKIVGFKPKRGYTMHKGPSA